MPEPRTRKAQLVGTWYPGTPREIEAMLDSWGDYIRHLKEPTGRTMGVIVPHAGWRFSGRLAAAALTLAGLVPGREAPELLVIMGGHLDHKDPIITYSEDFWETPLGPVELAPEMNAVLNEQVLAFETWSGPTNDNTIEILLPLVKALAPKARIWALRVPPASKALILGSTLAEKYRSKPEKMLLVASTDLTHYGSAYAFAPAGPGDEGEKFRFQNDRTFIEAALALQPLNMILAGIKNRAACSAGAAAATAEAARLLGARSKLLDHYSSRDIMPGEMSVGYAAISYGV